MSPRKTRLAAAAGGALVALAVAAPSGVASKHAPPCRAVARAPVDTGGAPGKTLATMSFTCTGPHSQAVATVQSQELIRGRWIHQATRAVTFFQVKGGHSYKATTPPIDCSPGSYRTIASVAAGGHTAHAHSGVVDITCAGPPPVAQPAG